ncbi:MAG TPA: trypsin-like peptidase domain-containing protein, partial [Candidatus Acidoferrum sp.]|nr:trypsin-like peptidase domain-containing protein [Candidatus Acidoferrum sp.]
MATVKALGLVHEVKARSTDVHAELVEDNKPKGSGPLRIASADSVQITPATHGTWENVQDGRLWRLRVSSEGATDLNFGFTQCWLPEGATLHISSETEDYFQGPFTAQDNKPHRQLWTPLIPGPRAVIELFVPTGTQEPQLLLSHINRGYRDMFHRQQDFPGEKAGSCNIDTVCSQGDAWRNEIRSVARYTINGISLCTGTLINNVGANNRNFFLTAAHCNVSAGNASTVVVYWNYQSPSCGLHSGGSLAQNQNSTTFRMLKADVDVALLELDDIPDSAFNVYYAGWDRSGAAVNSAVGIHHPNGDEKSITFCTTALSTVDSCIGGGGSSTHWQVNWSSGTTEPGSSGSGIWNPANRRIVGALSGGGASCDTPTLPDCYGKLSFAWDTGTTPATRLRDWLDPNNTGALGVDGRDPVEAPTDFNLARDFSTNSNPNGAWSYGWQSAVGGAFTPLSETRTAMA